MTALEAIQYIEHYTWSTTRLGLGRTKELLLNTFWRKVLYGLPYRPTLVGRLVQAGIMAALQIVLIPLLAKAINDVEKRAKL